MVIKFLVLAILFLPSLASAAGYYGVRRSTTAGTAEQRLAGLFCASVDSTTWATCTVQVDGPNTRILIGNGVNVTTITATDLYIATVTASYIWLDGVDLEDWISSIATSTGTLAGEAAILASTQTFTGQNTFTNMVTVSSEVVVASSVTASAFFGDGSGLTGIEGGDPDISFSYTGDIFDSTVTHIEGIDGIIIKQDLAIAGYDIRIGSATTDSFDIWLSSMATLNGTWGVLKTITVPASISSHTVTSSDGTLSAGGIVHFGFADVTVADPAGSVRFRIRN